MISRKHFSWSKYFGRYNMVLKEKVPDILGKNSQMQPNASSLFYVILSAYTIPIMLKSKLISRLANINILWLIQ